MARKEASSGSSGDGQWWREPSGHRYISNRLNFFPQAPCKIRL